ncbi:MAG: protein translocase subunit SecF, partial [Patescibacteria group bacterium]
IRELSRINPKESLKNIANSAVSQTLVRSVNNSLTIIFMLTALVILGGESTRWFATALLIGTVTGTYSSTFTAVPLLLVFERVFKKRK